MLTSVEHAKLKLNALVLRNPCEHIGELLSRIGRHYIYQVRQTQCRPKASAKLLPRRNIAGVSLTS